MLPGTVQNVRLNNMKITVLVVQNSEIQTKAPKQLNREGKVFSTNGAKTPIDTLSRVRLLPTSTDYPGVSIVTS